MNAQDLDKAIADRPFPKVTKEGMEKKIKEVTYCRFNATVTICNILLENGYSVRGESACVDPGNYDQKIGEQLAYNQAFSKLWPLEGYLLAEQNYQSTKQG